jgi:tetratricopeptide (TPR) repeat protein
VPDSPRIEELKRRVQSDPASIAFAALAEEYRRAERYEEAIETCKAGLVRHPSYLSAHVTLGRAFIEVGRLKNAREELEYVLKLAPENLAAIRGLAEIHHRMGEDVGEAHSHEADRLPEPAIAIVPPGAPLNQSSLDLPAVQPEVVPNPTVPAPAVAVLPEHTISVASLTSDGVPSPIDMSSADLPHVTYPRPVDPALAGLEEFLNAIIRARAERTAAR